MKIRATISARKLILIILLMSGYIFPIYGAKKNSTPSGTSIVKAKVSCKAQFTEFKNRAATHPGSAGIFVDVPYIYSGSKITYSTGKMTEPLKFEVTKAGIVTVAAPRSATDYLTSDGWKEVDTFYTQFNKKWMNLIFEKYLGEGEYELKVGRKGKRPPRLLIYEKKKITTPSDTPVVRAKVSCKKQFTEFKNKATTHPDMDTAGVFIDVPEIYSGWKISYSGDKPLKFKVKKAGIVTVATPQASTGYLTSDGWKEVGIYHLHFSNRQSGTKYTSLIFEKYLGEGEYELKGNVEGNWQPRPRLLKRN